MVSSRELHRIAIVFEKSLPANTEKFAFTRYVVVPISFRHNTWIRPTTESHEPIFLYLFQIQSVSQESKDWVLNNRVCDAPGSWFCPGQYPPELQKYLKDKKDFRQLEDFNTAGSDEDYQKEYFENLNRKSAGASPPGKKPKMKKLSATEIDLLNENWADNDVSTIMYELISKDKYPQLIEHLSSHPEIAHVRSEDGRGPMFWAHEYGRTKMIKLLSSLGVSEDRTDANGKKPGEK